MNKKLNNVSLSLASFVLATLPFSAFAGSASTNDLVESLEGNIHIDEVHHEAKSGGLPQFDLTTFPTQIFWLFVSFTILYIFFSKKTLPDLSSVMERRRNLIESELETAENKRRETENLKEQYDASIQEAVVKSKETIGKAKEKSTALSEKAAADFQTKAEKATKDTSTKANDAKASAMTELNSISAEIAVAAVEKITNVSVSKADALSIIEKNTKPKAKAA